MKHLILLILLVPALLFSGCATDRATQTGVTLVTMKVIENADDPRDKAERISVVVSDVEDYLNDGALTVTALEAYARSKLDPRRMTSFELLAWDEAISATMADIRKRTADEILGADAREAIRQTLAAIRRAILLEGY